MTPAEQSPTVLVTGSTSGIGAATARALAADGWVVVVSGRDTARGGAVVDEITSAGGRAAFVPADLTASPDELRRFAGTCVHAAGGRLDAVVHCAAVCPPVDTLSLSDADLETALATNIRAPHVLTAALVPGMLERGHGAIVVVGSWMAHLGSPFVGLYSATKAAEIQLARSWAAEFGARGVRVNTVSPGVTRAAGSTPDEVVGTMVARTPAQRTGTPEEVAAAICWLLSDAAGYLHGVELRVDGGISTTRTD